MERSGVHQDVVTFKTLIHGFCKEGKLHKAKKIFIEMEAANVTPNIVTYNTLIKCFEDLMAF